MTESDVAPRDDAPALAKIDADEGRDLAAERLDTVADSLFGRSVTINRPVAELYAFWRDFGNLATFMDNVVRIDVIDTKRSHWVVDAPGGKTAEWTSIITGEAENSYIAWQSEDGTDAVHNGRIDFRNAGARGTVVSVLMSYDPPAGVIGKIVAKIFQRDPATQARHHLRRFKQLMETGEIATSARTRALLETEKS